MQPESWFSPEAEHFLLLNIGVKYLIIGSQVAIDPRARCSRHPEASCPTSAFYRTF
jgi:hypothetical protein